jgi:hypothetical protein
VSEFKGFRLRGQQRSTGGPHTPAVRARGPNGGFPAAHADGDAQARVMTKVADLGPAFSPCQPNNMAHG